jgi:predicted ATPase/class 3 adenylate cyclase
VADLPIGTVTFLFSDVEGSTQLLERHGTAMGAALARHHELFEQIVPSHDGAIFETVGDAVYAAFAEPGRAVGAALDIQQSLATEDWGPIGRIAVRIAIHTGGVERRGRHYFGPALFRCARLEAIGYGEQVLISAATARMLEGDLPDGARLVDLGSHRLKDLHDPEHVYQLWHPRLRSEFPPLKSAGPTPHNLPAPVSTFVGREAELAELATLLAEHRLVTLTGPGGTGKTRLALEAARREVEKFADGVFLVELAAVTDVDEVPAALARTLGVRTDVAGAEQAVLEHLAQRHVLLVLDNFEQVIDAAPWVARILAEAPSAATLATSRQPLRLTGECEYRVNPLRLPDRRSVGQLAVLAQIEAVQLFCQRATSADARFSLTERNAAAVAAICQRLDGLPLAIELAAARLRSLDPADLLERLERRLPILIGGNRDREPRRQTLRASIAWSHELLDAAERSGFAQLAVFVGGFDLAAAEAVSQLDGPGVLDTIDSLAEKSLLYTDAEGAGGRRFAMLETIREYASEQLTLGGRPQERELRDRHAAYYAAMAESLEPRIRGAEQQEAVALVNRDLENIRAATADALAHGLSDLALRLTGSLWWYWIIEGRLAEGRRATEAALAMPGGSATLRAHALTALGTIQVEQGAAVRGATVLRQALALHRRSHDVVGETKTLNFLGVAASVIGHHRRAGRYLEAAAARARDAGDAIFEMWTVNNLAGVRYREGNLDAAMRGERAAVELAEELHDRHSLASGLSNLGLLYGSRGESVLAEDYLRRALEVSRELAADHVTSMAANNLAALLIVTGRLAEAAQFTKEAFDISNDVGDPGELLTAIDRAAQLAASCGREADAVRLIAASDAQRHRIEVPRPPEEQQLVTGWLGSTRKRLTKAVYEDARLKGSALEIQSTMREVEKLLGSLDR